jgi:transposase-like protein
LSENSFKEKIKREDFYYIEDTLVFQWGFEKISPKEIQKEIENLKSPRSTKGREVGFRYTVNGLEVVVWTTWLLKENKARESDSGWVIIRDAIRKNILYSSHPLHRTKNFAKNLLSQAWIAQWRIQHRPHCPECGKFMVIARGKGMKSRYWKCSNYRDHKTGKSVCRDWDFNLSPKAKAYLRRLRKKRRKYRDKRKKELKPNYVALKKRKKWEQKK